jgi:hypothetical protein
MLVNNFSSFIFVAVESIFDKSIKFSNIFSIFILSFVFDGGEGVLTCRCPHLTDFMSIYAEKLTKQFTDANWQ